MAFTFTLGKDAAAVLAGNGPNDEKPEARAFHVTQRAVGDAIEAFEDAFQLRGREPRRRGRGRGRSHPFLPRACRAAPAFHMVAGILHRVVQQV